MPSQDFSRPLIGAGASASNEFAHAEAAAGIDFFGAAELKRGFRTEIGITAFTSAGAGISKFVSASIEGTAFASARAGIQGQLSLNLFKEFGFIVKAEAVAEAAAGVKANLGINIGDFVNLALKDKNNLGLPIELLIMLLEEVEIGGAFYIDVSASAKAHCTLSLSGTLLPKPGDTAGFRFTTKAGAGLAKGVGMSFRAGIGFKDFRRFYGRAVDRTVDEVITQIQANMPQQAKALNPYISAFGPVAKISLRLAYDLGDKIIKNHTGRSAADAQTLCNECVKVIVEEIQRFTLEKMTVYGLEQFQQRITDLLASDTSGVWAEAVNERNALALILTKFPTEPFQPTIENVDYWKDLILKTIALVEMLFPGVAVDAALTEQITLLYCASELSMEAIRAKVNVATAYAVIAGAGSATADTEPFTSPLSVQPPDFIKSAINTKAGRAVNTDVVYADLLEYLVDDLIIDQVLAKIPELKTFIEIFKEDFKDAEREILKLLLNSAGAFIQGQNGKVIPKDSLQILVKSIDRFLTKKFRNEVLTEINKQITDPTLKIYLDEVLLSCVICVKDVALNAALDWEKAPYTNDDFTEALAGVMILFLGRSIVLMSDTLLSATQQEVLSICNTIASKIETNHRDVAALIPVLKDDNVKQLVVEALRIGGEVLGPLPDETRKRVRMLLYQVFDVVKPGEEKQLVEELRNQLFIPNVADIQSLCVELAGIAKDRFVLFAEKILLNIGQFILDSLEELFIYLLDLILNWEKNLAASLMIIAGELRTLDQKLLAANAAMIVQYRTLQTAYNAFIAKINSTQIKNAIKAALTDRFIATAELVLKDQAAYKLLPRNVKTTAENTLRSAVAAVLESPVLRPVFSSINAIANELDDLLPDARRLNASRNLTEQFLDLILDKLEEKIRLHFGSTKPGITVAINFSYTIPEVIITPAVHIPAKVITPAIHVPAVIIPATLVSPANVVTPAHTIPAVMSPAVNIPAQKTPAQTIRVNIPLGKIELQLDPFINLVRTAIDTADFYHVKLNEFAVKLGVVLAKELEKKADELKKIAVQKRQLSINSIAAELNDHLPEISILKPLALATHQKDVAVEIQLRQVPASYLGLQTDEVQRVHIFLNGQSIALSTLTDDELQCSRPHGIPLVQINYNVPKEHLIVGVNTLTLFIVGKGGSRQQQQQHFIYNPKAKPLSTIVQNRNTIQQMQQKISSAKKIAGDQHSFTFKNIRS